MCKHKPTPRTRTHAPTPTRSPPGHGGAASSRLHRCLCHRMISVCARAHAASTRQACAIGVVAGASKSLRRARRLGRRIVVVRDGVRPWILQISHLSAAAESSRALEPRVLLAKAELCVKTGKFANARPIYLDAIQSAARYKLRFEEALAHYELGVNHKLASGLMEQMEHLKTAVELLSAEFGVGAKHHHSLAQGKLQILQANLNLVGSQLPFDFAQAR